jgi:hypothetical protein
LGAVVKFDIGAMERLRDFGSCWKEVFCSYVAGDPRKFDED